MLCPSGGQLGLATNAVVGSHISRSSTCLIDESPDGSHGDSACRRAIICLAPLPLRRVLLLASHVELPLLVGSYDTV